MKKIIYVIGISVALLFTNMASAETKIGIVDVRTVIEKMPQYKEVSDKLNKEFDARGKSLKAEEQKAQDANARLQKDNLTLSKTEKEKLVKVITDFQTKANAFSSDFNKRQSEELDKLVTVVQDTVKKLVEEEKYDLILTSEAVLYTSNAVDVTDKVIEKATVKK